jgi:hypothetical protein
MRSAVFSRLTKTLARQSNISLDRNDVYHALSWWVTHLNRNHNHGNHNHNHRNNSHNNHNNHNNLNNRNNNNDNNTRHNNKHAYAGHPNSFTHVRVLLELHDRGNLGAHN